MKRGLALVVAAQLFAVAACDSPARPQSQPAVALAPSVTGAIVSCYCTTDGPTVWATVAAPVIVTNPGTSSVRVASVEARAFNQTRKTLISSTVRPNTDFAYPEEEVPAGGSLTLEAGLVYHPLPSPQDDVRFVVVVTFRDGSTARAEARLLTGA